MEMETYDRPKYLTSPAITIPTDKYLSITSPYGGILVPWVDPAPTAGTMVNVSVQVNNVGHYPAWRSEADTPAFADGLAAGAYNWAELLTPGFEVSAHVEQ